MRGLILGLAVGLAVLLTAGEGRAMTGQKLAEVCANLAPESPEDLIKFGRCFGYVEAIVDTGTLDEVTNKTKYDGGRTVCKPKTATQGQVVEVVKRFLKEFPQTWHIGADMIVAAALEWGFPCR